MAINTISTPLLADVEKGWFAENTNAPLTTNKRKINKGWYASFHKGAIGVIYMLGKAHLVGMDIEAAKPHISKALTLIEEKYINRPEGPKPGLHFGSYGIAVVLADAMRQGLIDSQTEYFSWINKLLEIDCNAFGYQSGLAGQAMAHLLCHPFLHPNKSEEKINSIINRLVDAQEKDGSWMRSLNEKKNRVTKGFAHGVAGIAYFLLEYAKQYDNKKALTSAELGLQWLIKKSIHVNGHIEWRSSSKKSISPWWCEGEAGIALAFIKAYVITGKNIYKEYASGALRIHHRNIIDNNLSQCHGMAGLGEVYLEAYKVFQEDEWLERAKWIVQVIMQLQKQHNIYGPYWIVEHERRPIPTFMTGNSGIIHFLIRHCYPERIGLPLIL